MMDVGPRRKIPANVMLENHEIADVFPMLPDSELATLAQDIADNKLIHPIVLFEEKILDGRNRYRAGKRARAKLVFVDFLGDYDEAVRFVASENLARRHLDNQQRQWCAAKLATLRRGRPSTENPPSGGITAAEAAEMMNVSPRGVERAKRVQTQGAPELVEAVEAKEVSLYAAADLAKLPEDEQREVIAAGPEAVKEKVTEMRARPPVEMSPTQKAASGKVTIDNLFMDLTKLMTQVKALTQAFADSGEIATQEQREIGVELARELLTAGEWLVTLLRDGQVSDEALSALLDGESK